VKTITITIQVPDGVNVAVGGAQQQVQQDRPFVERPLPPRPAGVCPIHDTAWDVVPAGTSTRTGKRYNAFWACPTRGCDQRPDRNAPVAQPVLVDISDGVQDDLPF